MEHREHLEYLEHHEHHEHPSAPNQACFSPSNACHDQHASHNHSSATFSHIQPQRGHARLLDPGKSANQRGDDLPRIQALRYVRYGFVYGLAGSDVAVAENLQCLVEDMRAFSNAHVHAHELEQSVEIRRRVKVVTM